jgi:hypothetical protein
MSFCRILTNIYNAKNKFKNQCLRAVVSACEGMGREIESPWVVAFKKIDACAQWFLNWALSNWFWKKCLP